MKLTVTVCSEPCTIITATVTRKNSVWKCWILLMVSVLKREQKEQDQKATIELSDEIGRRVRREKDRWKCHYFVTLSTHRKPGVLGCNKFALAHPGLLPLLLTQQPARHCRRAAEGKMERGSGFAGWLKRYNCFHKSQAFPGEGGYAAACTARLPLLEMKECPHWKACSTLGKGPSPSTQPLHLCIMDCHRKDKWKWRYYPGIYLWWIEQRMNFKLERDSYWNQKVKNQIF